MVLNTQTIQTGMMLLLPVPIAILAGILRQDKFPPIANEIISQAIVFLIALISFLFGVGGHLTGNPQVDFLALVAYCGWLSNTAPFKPLHVYLQTNLLSLGLGKAAEVEQIGLKDLKAGIDKLNAFFEGAAQNPQPVAATQGFVQISPVATTAATIPQVSFQGIPYQPSSTYPEMPVPPKG